MPCSGISEPAQKNKKKAKRAPWNRMVEMQLAWVSKWTRESVNVAKKNPLGLPRTLCSIAKHCYSVQDFASEIRLCTSCWWKVLQRALQDATGEHKFTLLMFIAKKKIQIRVPRVLAYISQRVLLFDRGLCGRKLARSFTRLRVKTRSLTSDLRPCFLQTPICQEVFCAPRWFEALFQQGHIHRSQGRLHYLRHLRRWRTSATDFAGGLQVGRHWSSALFKNFIDLIFIRVTRLMATLHRDAVAYGVSSGDWTLQPHRKDCINRRTVTWQQIIGSRLTGLSCHLKASCILIISPAIQVGGPEARCARGCKMQSQGYVCTPWRNVWRLLFVFTAFSFCRRIFTEEELRKLRIFYAYCASTVFHIQSLQIWSTISTALQELGKSIKVRPRLVASAIVYFKRFYCR